MALREIISHGCRLLDKTLGDISFICISAISSWVCARVGFESVRLAVSSYHSIALQWYWGQSRECVPYQIQYAPRWTGWNSKKKEEVVIWGDSPRELFFIDKQQLLSLSPAASLCVWGERNGLLCHNYGSKYHRTLALGCLNLGQYLEHPRDHLAITALPHSNILETTQQTAKL